MRRILLVAGVVSLLAVGVAGAGLQRAVEDREASVGVVGHGEALVDRKPVLHAEERVLDGREQVRVDEAAHEAAREVGKA